MTRHGHIYGTDLDAWATTHGYSDDNVPGTRWHHPATGETWTSLGAEPWGPWLYAVESPGRLRVETDRPDGLERLP